MHLAYIVCPLIFLLLKDNVDPKCQQYTSNQNKNTHSSIFNEYGSLNSTSATSDIDFDLTDVIVRAVNLAKDKRCGYFNNSSRNKKYKHACGVCQKSVNANQKAIFCIFCSLWYHRKCNGTSIKEYEILLNENDDIPWLCTCSMDEMASKFPFGYLSKFELNNLYGVDLPSQLELLPSYKLRLKLSQIPNLDGFDIEENYVKAIKVCFKSFCHLDYKTS